ncbi:MAG: hypothetical protein HON65_14165 [Rhodospirillales bacterium]|nr:hypothetical protein [Rhodospirillales bacterium]
MGDEIATLFGNAIAYGGGGAGVAYLFFRYLGSSWIENKFATQLEKFKHNQDIEIQRLRIEIDSTLSGTIKLQEMEFGTIPEAWRLLNIANNEVVSLVNPIQRQNNLDRMEEEELEEFLNDTALRDSEKRQVRLAQEKRTKYYELDFYHRFHRVNMACSELNIYVALNGIFFPKEIKQNFESIVEMLHSATNSKMIDQNSIDFTHAGEAWVDVVEKIIPFRKAIEDEIYERLHSHGMTKE